MIPPFLAYDQAMTCPALILVAGRVLIEPAFQLVAATAQAAGEGIAAGAEYTAEQLGALHKFLGDEGFYELFGGREPTGGVD